MSKKIDWLDNFAENYKKGMNKTASAKKGEEIILDKALVKGAKLGDRVKLNNKMYRIADLDFEDEKGPGVVAEEIPMSLDNAEDPMAMEMGTPAHSTMENKCTVAPERAYTDAGNIFDLDVREQEQAKFEGEAAETASHMQAEQNIDRTQRDTTIVLPSMNAGSEVPGMAAEMTPATPAATPVEVKAPVEEIPASEMEDEVEEPVMEDDFEESDDFEEADDLNIEKSEEETCPECGKDAENCECKEEEEDEDEKLMASLASNRILKRILTAKRR